MSALSSVSSFTSVPANVPGCDAWGNFTVGSPGNVTLLDGYGISGVTRASTGIYGISFSNPERFGGGAYVVLATPEFTIDAGYGPVAVPSPNGKTGAGLSAGLQISTYTYPNGFHPGGGTAALNDPQTGAYRVNMAAFSFATDSDLRSPAVLNVLKWSESFSNAAWTKSGSVSVALSTDGTKAPDGSTPTVMNEGISATSAQKVIQQYTGNYPVSVVNKPFTGSVYVKAGTRFRGRIIVYDASATFFGVLFDLQTKTLTSSGPSSAILSSSSITDVGGGWFRIVVSGYFTNPTPNGNQTGVYINIAEDAGATPNVSYIGESKFFYVWGAQLEEGSVATPYIKTEGTVPVLGNQDARKRLVPGAGGLGADGNTYSSTPHKNFDKRRAVAYGTIVIPGNKGYSSSPSAYIENGFNIKSVSAGGNSRYDLSFVQPLANDSYCVVLSGEYESVDTSPLPEEFALLAVRAGAGNKYKTPLGFRVEELRQYTVDNSWIEQSVRYQKGYTQRIHFMVFGEFTQGQSFLTNPYRTFMPVVGQNGQNSNLDYDVYAMQWGWSIVTDTTVTSASHAAGYVTNGTVNKPAVVPFIRIYGGGCGGFFDNTIQADLGATYINNNGLPDGNVTAWANVIKNVPQSRRGVELHNLYRSFPLTTTLQRERLIQYYALRDGYTYTSTVHPNGVTNSGFTLAAAFTVQSGVVYPVGTTFTGATFSASRRVLGLISDTQAQDVRETVNTFIRQMGAAGATPGILADDPENAPGSFSLYNIGNPKAIGARTIPAQELITNAGIAATAFVAGTDPDRAIAVSGITAELLYDYYGISAAGSSSKFKLVNTKDPEQLRYLANDPRVQTYKFSPGGGPTTDASPTIASRFIEIYGNMCKRWNVTGTTATSITHAAEILYAHGGAYSYMQNGGATFPYFASERNASALGYQARTMNNFNPYLIWCAWDQTVKELMQGHYRSMAYSDAMNAGIVYSQYGAGSIDADNMEIGSDGNAFPVIDFTLTANNTHNSPTIYGEITGSPVPANGNMVVFSGFKPNPVTRAEKYCYNGRTFAAGNNYDYVMTLGSVTYYLIPDGCKKYYPKTAVGNSVSNTNPNNSSFSNTDVQYGAGSGYGKTGAIWTPLSGATVDSAPATGATGFTAWGGFTALAGDYIWVQNSSGVTYSTPLTIGQNIGIVASGTKQSIAVLESLAPYGISGGTTFTIEHTTNNHSYMTFIHELQRLRAMLRSSTVMVQQGFSPYITAPNGTTNTKWAVDHRYWWEAHYHILLSGARYLYWFINAASSADTISDGNCIYPQRLLDEWRNISGNSPVLPVTLDPIQLDSEVITSGGRVLKGKLEGMYLWRISVRPGIAGFGEGVILTQNSRSDIPRRLSIPGGSVPEHRLRYTDLFYAYGTRGIWLVSKSAVPPVYTISDFGLNVR